MDPTILPIYIPMDYLSNILPSEFAGYSILALLVIGALLVSTCGICYPKISMFLCISSLLSIYKITPIARSIAAELTAIDITWLPPLLYRALTSSILSWLIFCLCVSMLTMCAVDCTCLIFPLLNAALLYNRAVALMGLQSPIFMHASFYALALVLSLAVYRHGRVYVYAMLYAGMGAVIAMRGVDFMKSHKMPIPDKKVAGKITTLRIGGFIVLVGMSLFFQYMSYRQQRRRNNLSKSFIQ